MRILVIPGIGDIHWAMLKMEGFIARHCPGEKPEVWIWDIDGRKRSEDFVRRIPFVTFGGYWEQPLTGQFRRDFHEMYMGTGCDIRWGYRGFDALICPNGSLRNGRPWSAVLPEYPTNWDYEVTETHQDAIDADALAHIWGDFILAGFSDFGMFERHWAPYFAPGACADLLRRVPAKVVLTGSYWDNHYNCRVRGPNILNMVDKTPLGLFLALLRRSRGMVGWCGGNTIMSTHFGKPTLMIWSQYFRAHEFYTNWVKPEMVGTTYHPTLVNEITNAKLLEKIRCWVQTN